MSTYIDKMDFKSFPPTSLPASDLPLPEEPEKALAAVVALRRLANQLERASVAEAVAQGWTWAEIADVLGVTRQAVHKKHSKMVAEQQEARDVQSD